jgi:cell division protein FtsL
MRDLSLAIPQGLGKRKTKSWSTTTQINVLLLILIAILGLSYLFFVNDLGTKGYEINKLEQQLDDLQDSQKQLQLQSSDLQSITRIQQQAQALGFVPATNVTYLKEGSYALK